MLRLNQKAVLWVVVLFAVEVLIALYLSDPIIRPYGGDLLATLLVYAALRIIFVGAASLRLALCSFTVGAVIELAQLFQLPTRLGWAQHTVLRIVLGTTFQWGDLVAYALGVSVAWLIDERTTWMR